MFQGPSKNNSRILRPIKNPEGQSGSLETEKIAHRIHYTLETGLQIIPRSLVAPTRGSADRSSCVFRSHFGSRLNPRAFLLLRLLAVRSRLFWFSLCFCFAAPMGKWWRCRTCGWQNPNSYGVCAGCSQPFVMDLLKGSSSLQNPA